MSLATHAIRPVAVSSTQLQDALDDLPPPGVSADTHLHTRHRNINSTNATENVALEFNIDIAAAATPVKVVCMFGFVNPGNDLRVRVYIAPQAVTHVFGTPVLDTGVPGTLPIFAFAPGSFSPHAQTSNTTVAAAGAHTVLVTVAGGSGGFVNRARLHGLTVELSYAS